MAVKLDNQSVVTTASDCQCLNPRAQKITLDHSSSFLYFLFVLQHITSFSTMGKSQKKRSMRRHNPMRVPDSHLPKGLASAESASSKKEAILPIIQKVCLDYQFKLQISTN